MSNDLILFLELLAIGSLLVVAAIFAWWRLAGPPRSTKSKLDPLPPSVRYMTAEEIARQPRHHQPAGHVYRDGGNPGGSA